MMMRSIVAVPGVLESLMMMFIGIAVAKLHPFQRLGTSFTSETIHGFSFASGRAAGFSWSDWGLAGSSE
jgi:hypothetical protein